VAVVEDIDGRQVSRSTNPAGNFFVRIEEFVPNYPIEMKVRSADGMITQQMQTLASRDGSCADCHVDPASPTSPGPVYLSMGVPGAGPGRGSQ
jgi:hypothetical protein